MGLMRVRRLTLAALASLCVVVGGGLVFAGAPALAVTKYVQVSSFGSGGVLPSSPFGVAVEQASGEVFVADRGSVQRFTPVNRPIPSAGYSLSSPLSGSFTNAFGVGVDDSGGLSQGDVYVADIGAGVVDKFEASGLPDLTTPQIGAGASPLALSAPSGVAIDPADGDVYVTDAANSVVDIFTSAGVFVSQFATGSEPTGLAFNSTGSDLYVVTSGVEEFDASGSPVDQTAGPNAGTNIVDGSGEAGAVAVDASTNDVYVFERGGNVAAYESSGAPLSAFNTGVFFSRGIAVDSATHTVFVSDLSNSVVDVFALVRLPAVSTGQATGVNAVTSATLEGTINPEGEPVTSCDFEYGTSSAYGQTVACAQTPAEIGSGSAPVPVSAAISGLQPSTLYHYRLAAASAGGTNDGEEQTFTTLSPPSVSEVGTTSATLNAQVNAGGSPTTYQFEYGTSISYGSTTPQGSLGAGGGEAHVELSGLQPDTTYHFRVLATNLHGTTPGVDATFTTFPPALSTLPDGRVYEMVTPAANQNANVYSPNQELDASQSSDAYTERPFQAAADGDAVAYVGDPSSGGSGNEGEGGGNEFLATRAGTGGWIQTDIQPPGYLTPTYQAFSSDLSIGILNSCESNLPPLSADAPGGGYDVLYTRASSDGSFHALLTTTPPNRSAKEFASAGVHGQSGRCSGSLAYAGASSDLSHLLFEANDALTANALDPGVEANNLYDSVAGQLSLVNVLPDGAPDPNATFGSPPPSSNEPPDFSHVISADGSRIFWTDLNTGELYVRENGTATVPVSAGSAHFWTATPDGRYVFYTEGGALYQFDVESETREELAGAGAEVQGVIGAGEDGSYVYFVANGALASGAAPQTCLAGQPSTGCNLYVLHNGVTTFIATLSPADDENGGGPSGRSFGDWRPGLGSRTAEVTPDGHSLVFMSQQSLTGYDNTGDSQAFTAAEVYVYDADAGRVFCASCDLSGEPPSIPANRTSYLPISHSDTYQPRWISEDGSRVFFDSAKPLLPQATNGKQDVYEWERDGAGSCQEDRGCVYLLSGATSSDASFLIDASANGDDVFIATRAQLVPEDQNGNFNLFDARVGGVQPPSPAATCSGVGCQGALPAPPVFTAPASVTFAGVGNLASSPGASVKPRSKPLTKAQKLAKALKVCKAKRSRRGRAGCEAQARKRYGAKAKSKAKQSARRGK
jgi:DNA-binding beta-propeller fold protein YncE